jgi:vinculin
MYMCVQGGKGYEEAGENRNYLANRMTDEVGEIVRVLQLVTYDEDEWSGDNLQVRAHASLMHNLDL